MLCSPFDTNLTPIPWTIGSCEVIYFLVKLRSETVIQKLSRGNFNKC